MPSGRTIERLSLYRHLLAELMTQGERYVYSHQIAAMVRATAAQVRHDMMAIGYSGSPNQGYDVAKLLASIGEFLDTSTPRNVALVGVGNLGRAILSNYAGRTSHLNLVAAFDCNPERVQRLIHGCPCYPVSELVPMVREDQISIGIIAVPPGEAQGVAESLCEAGVSGILNFAPVRLRAPASVYVQDVNITIALEKVSYFARENRAEKEANV